MNKAIILELNGSGGRYRFNETDIYAKIRDHTFKPLRYDPYSRELRETDNISIANVIFVRDRQIVTQRVRTAGKVKVFSEEF